MKLTLIIITGFLLFAILLYTWLNRDSDRVVLTLASVVMIGTLGFFTKESISNKLETFEVKFPVAVMYSTPNYLPLNIRLPYGHDMSMCIQNIDSTDLEYGQGRSVDIGYAQDIYSDVLEYIVIKSLFDHFHQGWLVETESFRSPNGISMRWSPIETNGKAFSFSETLDLLSDNYFVKKNLQQSVGLRFQGDTGYFPPNTRIEIDKGQAGFKTSIIIDSGLIDLEINLQKMSSSVGIGEYEQLLGIQGGQASSKNLGTSMFLFSIKYTQDIWRNGNPDMKKHRQWADSIVSLLQSTFDFNQIREDHIQRFQMHGPAGVRMY